MSQGSSPCKYIWMFNLGTGLLGTPRLWFLLCILQRLCFLNPPQKRHYSAYKNFRINHSIMQRLDVNTSCGSTFSPGEEKPVQKASVLCGYTHKKSCSVAKTEPILWLFIFILDILCSVIFPILLELLSHVCSTPLPSKLRDPLWMM